MNKAFVKENDGLDEIRCPGCDSVGAAVGQPVLDYHIRPEFRAAVGDEAYFCRYAGCPIAYFSRWAGHVTVDQLLAPITPKSPDASLCSCFPFTLQEIEADAEQEIPVRIRDLYQKSKSADARCFEKSPDGQCCLTEIQRIYFRLKQP